MVEQLRGGLGLASAGGRWRTAAELTGCTRRLAATGRRVALQCACLQEDRAKATVRVGVQAASAALALSAGGAGASRRVVNDLSA